MENLTKDAQKLITVLYKDYLKKLKSGMSKTQAKYFGDVKNIHSKLVPELPYDDVFETCHELKRSGMISSSPYDNEPTCITITDSGIIRLENRFKNGFKDFIDTASKFIP